MKERIRVKTIRAVTELSRMLPPYPPPHPIPLSSFILPMPHVHAHTQQGDYPPEMRERVKDRLPEFTAQQKADLKGSNDFFGINHYATNLIQVRMGREWGGVSLGKGWQGKHDSGFGPSDPNLLPPRRTPSCTTTYSNAYIHI